MTTAQVITVEMKKLDANNVQAHIQACERIWQELNLTMGFPDDPKDMLAFYVAYLTARHMTWKDGILNKIRAFWKSRVIKIHLRNTIAELRKHDYKSGDLLIKNLAAKIEEWL